MKFPKGFLMPLLRLTQQPENRGGFLLPYVLRNEIVEEAISLFESKGKRNHLFGQCRLGEIRKA